MHPVVPHRSHSLSLPDEARFVLSRGLHLEDDGDNVDQTPIHNPYPSKMIPPLNFAMVSDGIYRSGYPNQKNFAFLRTLRLKSVL